VRHDDESPACAGLSRARRRDALLRYGYRYRR
jgi:hypothetical protein